MTKTRAQLDKEIAEAMSGGRPKEAKASRAYLSVEGVGRRLRHGQRGYEIHWNWITRRDGQKIDSGALTGGDIPEFYETWPDYHGLKITIEQMKKILREWISAGEFGAGLSTKINVSMMLGS